MSSNWYATTLGEICKFTAGSAFKPEHQGGTSGQYPFIKVSDMNLSGNEIFICHANNFVSSELKDGMNAKEHPAGATVFAKIGVALQSNRRRLLVKPTIIDNNMMSATPKTGKVSSRFLYFVLSTLDFNTISAGSALPYLNVSDLQKMSVRIPRDAKVQQAIENVLGAIDDRIILLRETNTTLEAIAQALFKSWFVDFDPVHAKMQGRTPEGMDEATTALFPDSFEDSELGPVPKGWRIETLGDVCSYLNRGISPKYLEEGGVLVINQKCIRDFSVDYSKARRHDSAQRKIDGRQVEVGDILVNSTGVGTLGRVAQVLTLDEVTIVDSHVTVVRAGEKLSWPYLGQWMIRQQPNIEAMGEGSTGQTELARSKLAVLPILVPSADALMAFDALVKSLKERVAVNEAGASGLAKLRDTLLPRLISGQLRISEAQNEMENV